MFEEMKQRSDRKYKRSVMSMMIPNPSEEKNQSVKERKSKKAITNSTITLTDISLLSTADQLIQMVHTKLDKGELT